MHFEFAPMALSRSASSGLEQGSTRRTVRNKHFEFPSGFMSSCEFMRTATEQRFDANERGDDSPGQYLFLTVRGAPMYASSQEEGYNSGLHRKYIPRGQAVRQYIAEYIIPEIRKTFHASFSYRFHDLRATFGMNMVDEMAPLMDRREITYSHVLDFVRVRMCHESLATTERYIKYRGNLKIKQKIQDDWEVRLRGLVEMAMDVGGGDGKI
jgi:hypothetical protein